MASARLIYEKSSHIACLPAEVFEFCRQGESFRRIFPDPITPTADAEGFFVHPGRNYSFIHWMFGLLPVRWDVRIVHYIEDREYSDFQVRGPFRFFCHTHRCEPETGGTRYTDSVECETLFGKAFDRAVTRRLLERTFSYRHQQMKLLLEER